MSISIHDDSDLEDPEEFKISLSSGDNTVYIDIESAVVEIRDNDGNDNGKFPTHFIHYCMKYIATVSYCCELREWSFVFRGK